MKEAGVDGVEVPVWFGVLAPAAHAARDGRRAGRGACEARRTTRRCASAWTNRAPSRSATRRRNSRTLLREEVAKWAEVVKVSGAQAPN